MIVIDSGTASAEVRIKLESGTTRLLCASGLDGAEEIVVSVYYDEDEDPVPAINPDGSEVVLTAAIPMAMLSGEAEYVIAKASGAARITLGYKR